MNAAEVGPVASKTSLRLIVSLTGLPALLREQRRDRIEVGDGLAAEAAADLHRDDFDRRLRHAEDRRRLAADAEGALRAASRPSAGRPAPTSAVAVCGSM